MKRTFIEALDIIILPAVIETLYLVTIATIASSIIAFMLSIILYITKKYGLKENKFIYRVLGSVINVIRSIPFIILSITVIPLQRIIVGTSVGVNAALVPLIISSTAFMTRLFTNSLNEVSDKLIEVGHAFGLKDVNIMKYIVVKESIPSIVQDIILATISIIGSTAMVGAIGGGGLGSVAIVYGYQNFNPQIMYGTILIIILLVFLAQGLGNLIYKKTLH